MCDVFKSDGKVTVVAFLDDGGALLVNFLKQGRTINDEYYTSLR